MLQSTAGGARSESDRRWREMAAAAATKPTMAISSMAGDVVTVSGEPRIMALFSSDIACIPAEVWECPLSPKGWE